MQVTRRSAIVSLLSTLAVSAAHAKARPFLLITGRTRSGTEEVWTRAAVEALGADALETSTPWHHGTQRFEGVRLARLLDHVGADGLAALILHAMNDYTALVPLADVVRYDPLLALRRNGADMPVADRGPLFLVYPFDKFPELDGPGFRARSIWQVDAMDLR